MAVPTTRFLVANGSNEQSLALPDGDLPNALTTPVLLPTPLPGQAVTFSGGLSFERDWYDMVAVNLIGGREYNFRSELTGSTQTYGRFEIVNSSGRTLYSHTGNEDGTDFTPVTSGTYYLRMSNTTGTGYKLTGVDVTVFETDLTFVDIEAVFGRSSYFRDLPPSYHDPVQVGTIYDGGSFGFDAVIGNIGKFGAGRFAIDFYLSSDTTISEADTLAFSHNVNIGIAVDHQLRIIVDNATFDREALGLEPGRYYLGAIVRPVSGYPDENLSNNTSRVVEVYLDEPPVVDFAGRLELLDETEPGVVSLTAWVSMVDVDWDTVPTSYLHKVRAPIGTTGNLYVSGDQMLDSADLFLATWSTPGFDWGGAGQGSTGGPLVQVDLNNLYFAGEQAFLFQRLDPSPGERVLHNNVSDAVPFTPLHAFPEGPVVASDAADIVLGTPAADILVGAQGADTVIGSGGHDLLYGDGRTLVHTQVSAQIYRLYAAVFGREPDWNGHQSWAERLTQAEITLLRAASDFVASPEFQETYGDTTNAEFVTLLYLNVLNRAPDQIGLDGWIAALQDGMSRAQVVLHFAESPEHVTRSAAAQTGYDIAHTANGWTDEVYRLYLAILDREPDTGGLLGWIDGLARGALSLDDVIERFMASPEFQRVYGATTDQQFVTLLYDNVLGRGPDPNGLQGWLEALDGGMTREKLVRFFVDSREFIAATADDLRAFIDAVGPHDQIRIGPGDAVVAGGLFSDSFIFLDDGQASTVTVTDLELWDRLDFSAFGQSPAQILDAMEQQGADVVLTLGAETVIFANTDLDAVTEDMILT
ncbi:DUF4214 domain-containing protein [Antarctobacter sp.]|uniref:DUF4214 domain-containing protein n=1 Tax=Antarctobacter sp. TaxID=1872577 RepID=UPI003A8F29BF